MNYPARPTRFAGGPHADHAALPSRRALLRTAVVLSVALPLAACGVADDPLASQAGAGDSKNFIAGDGSVEIYDAAERGDGVEVSGTFYDGADFNSQDWAGQVTVLNFWYAACAPCRLEAPDLAALSTEFEGQGVQFIGINVRDQKATAEAFERNFEIPYPSAPDADGGILLALSQYVNPQAVPTTLVLDKQGRVAARILGVADKSTLKGLIEDRLGETA